MDFEFTEEQETFRRVIRDFAEREFTKEVVETYELHDNAGFPWDIFYKLSELGVLAVSIPEEHGGLGLNTVTSVLVMEELSRGWTGAALSMYAVPCSLYAYPIYTFGTKEQVARFVKPLIDGEILGGFALTEPNAGSWAANQQTRALLEGNYYRLNGTKTFITNCGLAKYYVVFARTRQPEEDLRQGISCFVVETKTPGLAEQCIPKWGQKVSPFGELVFSDCLVPKENLLGAEDEGYKIALKTLDTGRVFIAAQAVGIAQAAYESAVKYAKERVTFGQTIASHQLVQKMITEIAGKLAAMRSLTYRAAWLKDQGKRFSTEASMAKLNASEWACDICRVAVQIHGGYGYTKEFPVMRYLIEALALPLYEGASQIQEVKIAQALTKY